MRIVEIHNNVWHVADNMREWREEVWKLSYLPFGARKYEYTPHHIIGRHGILKLIIENGVYIDASIHAMQKSTKKKDREYVENWVKRKIGNLRYRQLQQLKDYLNKHPWEGKA